MGKSSGRRRRTTSGSLSLALRRVNILSKGSRRKLREPSKHKSPFIAGPVADGLPEAHPKVAKLQSDGGKQETE